MTKFYLHGIPKTYSTLEQKLNTTILDLVTGASVVPLMISDMIPDMLRAAF